MLLQRYFGFREFSVALLKSFLPLSSSLNGSAKQPFFATAAASPFTAHLQRFMKPFYSAATALFVSYGHFNSQEKLKTMLMQTFGVTIKKHYGMLWYFWSGQLQNWFIMDCREWDCPMHIYKITKTLHAL